MTKWSKTMNSGKDVRKTVKKNENDRKRMLLLIRKQPGIRPSELNRLMNRKHSASLRNTLIRIGLVRKKSYCVIIKMFRRKRRGSRS